MTVYILQKKLMDNNLAIEEEKRCVHITKMNLLLLPGLNLSTPRNIASSMQYFLL